MSNMKFTITDEDVLRATMVKPGWAPVFISDVRVELSSKKDSNNVVVEGEHADKDSEYYRVPFIVWLNEKAKERPGGMVSFAKAMLGGKLPSGKNKEIDFSVAKGMYLYGKWGQVNQAKEGQPESIRNGILDWAPLPPKFDYLLSATPQATSEDVAGFEA